MRTTNSNEEEKEDERMRRKEREQEAERKEGKEQDIGQGRARQGRAGQDVDGWMRDRMLSKVRETQQNNTELSKRGTKEAGTD